MMEFKNSNEFVEVEDEVLLVETKEEPLEYFEDADEDMEAPDILGKVYNFLMNYLKESSMIPSQHRVVHTIWSLKNRGMTAKEIGKTVDLSPVLIEDILEFMENEEKEGEDSDYEL